MNQQIDRQRVPRASLAQAEKLGGSRERSLAMCNCLESLLKSQQTKLESSSRAMSVHKCFEVAHKRGRVLTLRPYALIRSQLH